jgi:hypothetical protein
VLIVGYQRVDAIRDILTLCANAGVRDVLLSIDFPRNLSSAEIENHHAIRELVIEKQQYFQSLSTRFLRENVGCSANVLSACDWAFDLFESVAVLEDDCIPSLAFFQFCEDADVFLSLEKDVLLACGTQFCPEILTHGKPFTSKYALTWGWFTQSTKWKIIKQQLVSRSEAIGVNLLSLNKDHVYWSEGARRAYLGYVDVWDTALVSLLQHTNYLALLPAGNLVTNIGNDVVATHTGMDRTWTQLPSVEYFSNSLLTITSNDSADAWLRKNFFKIRSRHLFTTRFTRLIDLMHSPGLESLLIRWKNASQ